MVDVALRPLQDVLTGTGPAPAVATATVYRAFQPAVRVEGDAITFPSVVEVDFTLGDASVLPLQHLPADCYYQIVVAPTGVADSRLTLRLNAVLPAGDGPFVFGDLITVTPQASVPVPGTTVGDVYLAALQAVADQATAAANIAAQARDDVEAVIATNDGIMVAAFNNLASSFRVALDATYVTPHSAQGIALVQALIFGA